MKVVFMSIKTKSIWELRWQRQKNNAFVTAKSRDIGKEYYLERELLKDIVFTKKTKVVDRENHLK